MPINLYIDKFNEFMRAPELQTSIHDAIDKLKSCKRIFFIGNGGSNSICSHMMQDFAKIGGYRTFSFSDPSLITCFANDYGYENAMQEWLNIHFEAGDALIAISSSGESKNILNAVSAANAKSGLVITLSGFEKNNALSKTGEINFILPIKNYGIVECYHQVILHIILDSLHVK